MGRHYYLKDQTEIEKWNDLAYFLFDLGLIDEDTRWDLVIPW